MFIGKSEKKPKHKSTFSSPLQQCTASSPHVQALSPEETLPGGEVSAFEERVLQNALHATQSLDHVCAVVVQVPQFSIVSLVGPPEWILLQHLHSGKINHNILYKYWNILEQIYQLFILGKTKFYYAELK